MKKRFAFVFSLVFITATGFCQSYKVLPSGILITLHPTHANTKHLIELEPVTAAIIHVTESPASIMPEEKSLIAIPPKQYAHFSVTKKGDLIILSTQKLNVSVSLKTGVVAFAHRDGSPILSEMQDSSMFHPAQAGQDKGYTIQQVFNGSSGEAIYGLGQQQSDVLDYKHKSEILYQYNTKVSIPFITSTKNYGILWDNYSLSKYGDPRNYCNLNQFVLFNKNGEQGSLTATYTEANGHSFVRQEDSIDYENLTTVKNFPDHFNFNNATITWEGWIEPRISGDYKFNLYYAGYTTVYMNDSLIVPERWRTAWNPNTYRYQIHLTAGKRTRLKLVWHPDGGISYIGLKALSICPIEKNGNISFWSEIGDKIDYYFIDGNSLDQVISGYRTITGKATIMPSWAMGYWQSRERYKTQEELLSVVKEYRKLRLPLDNIVQDWFYWPENAWGSHRFDKQRFPHPTAMIDSVHLMHAHIMISVWPKFYATTKHFKEFAQHGWMYMRAIHDSIRDWVGKGYVGSFYDAYSPGARKLFWDQINANLFSKGIDAWWMDASEPDIESNSSITYRKALMNPTALGSSDKYFNAYALMNAKGIYEGQRTTDPNKRVFILTRSAFAGSQHYAAATWSGDIGTRWEDMQAQIPAGLNFAMSGIPFWTMDIGGFCVEHRYETAKEGSSDLTEWRELNARWFQFGTFCPLFRSHGQFPYREIYNISPVNSPIYNIMAYYDRLRYRLMPYIYTLDGMTYLDNYTIMRPLAMNFESDSKTFDVKDQYMFGPALMVCPVYKYLARTREIYFPASAGWYDFYSGQYITGGEKKQVEAPLSRMPLYVAAGAILPMGPVMEYTRQTPATELEIRVYAGCNGLFSLYEDEGINYNYEKGDYSNIPFRYNDKTKTLSIGDRIGNFNGMLKNRIFKIVLIDKKGESKPVLVHYNGHKVVVSI
ncbi:glycoside hydrolase family 31 protein [Microbacter margulisiae]|uniref:Alpha-D-xyloside xylohydrolase n=1 Tax=Microbacter margulisiae TaxID=1350067 RepID=A0A7W5DU60_9PORP|nr:TIM-barrel domain-containing protein [Microbacter margulisiae]MBB3188768.1 alpha-D-xyloside xylohydrolase [Microbacter margulisiae]